MKSILFALLIGIPIAVMAQVDDCPNPLYKRWGDRFSVHTGCKQPNPECNIVRAGMTQAERDEVLRAHNSLRQKLASGGENEKLGFTANASNMMKLVWDEELAFIAQALADQCENQDSAYHRMVDEYSVGQNLRSTSSSRPSEGYEGNWTQVTKNWYDHIKDAPFTLVDNYSPSPSMSIYYDPFSQIIWAETWKIGCGFTAHTKSGEVRKLYVCNYGPTGNVANQPTYKRGAPASQCPDNTAPARDYPALCEALDSTGPKDANEKKLRGKSLFYCDFSDGTVCGLNILHDNNAFLVRNNLFQYLSFRVSASKKVSIEVPQSILQSRDPWCLTFETRQGASEGTDKAKNQFFALFVNGYPGSSGTAKKMLESTEESVVWHQNMIDPVLYGQSASITLTFEVPAGAGEQYLEFKNIVVSPGNCPY